MTDTTDLRSMNEFDPDVPAEVYDSLNAKLFVWEPRWAGEYRAEPLDREGRSGWDGLILTGWRPI